MRLLFLDMDGVLNGHDRNADGYCGIAARCVPHLNRIIAEADCRIVLSSSWRYMVYGGEMTLRGFEYMLITHGVNCSGRFVGMTCKDEDTPVKDEPDTWSQRSWQIQEFVRLKRHDAYCVLDDGQLCWPVESWPQFVRTDSGVGLTATDAERAIEILAEKKPACRAIIRDITSRKRSPAN